MMKKFYSYVYNQEKQVHMSTKTHKRMVIVASLKITKNSNDPNVNQQETG